MAKVSVVRRTPPMHPWANDPRSAGWPKATARMVQVSSDNPFRYFFPYTPVTVNFPNVGSTFVEIERPGDYSLISRRAPNLLQATLRFRVAHRQSLGQLSIERDLRILRSMARSTIPVRFLGLDDFLGATGVKFHITTMSIDVVRRTARDHPSQADVDLTITEVRNPEFVATTLSRITYPPEPVARTATPAGSGSAGAYDPSPTPANNYTDVSAPPQGVP